MPLKDDWTNDDVAADQHPQAHNDVASRLNELSNVDNTADTAKPVSTAQQTALDLRAPIASPTFTGTVAGITKSMVGLGSADNTADTAKPVSTAQQAALDLKADLTALALKANLASPALTGTPTAPTATAGTNTTQLATTAFVHAAAGATVQVVTSVAPPSSPAVNVIWVDLSGIGSY